MRDRKHRLLVLWLLATTLACFDLWLNVLLSSPDWALHQRSTLWAIGCTVVLAAVVPLTRVRSSAVTVGAGVLSGGVLGNLISGVSDHLVVPNPLLLDMGNAGIAFNLADAFILTGNLILMVSLCAFAVRHRKQLRSSGLLLRRESSGRAR